MSDCHPPKQVLRRIPSPFSLKVIYPSSTLSLSTTYCAKQHGYRNQTHTPKKTNTIKKKYLSTRQDLCQMYHLLQRCLFQRAKSLPFLLSQHKTYIYFWQAYWHELNIVLYLEVSSTQKNHRQSWPWGMQTSQKVACFSSTELTTSSERCQPRLVDVSHNPNFSAASRLFCVHCSLKSKFHALLCHYLPSCSFRSCLFSVLSLLPSHFLKGWRVMSPLFPLLEHQRFLIRKPGC